MKINEILNGESLFNKEKEKKKETENKSIYGKRDAKKTLKFELKNCKKALIVYIMQRDNAVRLGDKQVVETIDADIEKCSDRIYDIECLLKTI